MQSEVTSTKFLAQTVVPLKVPPVPTLIACQHSSLGTTPLR